ncbi:MAG: hypothetical protein WDW36_001506 [Sanguina aurantia]
MAILLPPPTTISGGNGRIWSQGSPSACFGLLALLQNAPSQTSGVARGRKYTALALSSTSEQICTVDSHGTVYLLNQKQNRYTRLDQVGSPGTAAVFSDTSHMLFVAFEDATIRCYHTTRCNLVSILREHRSAPLHLHVNDATEELLSTSVDGILLWSIKTLTRKRVLGSGPYGARQAVFSPDEQSIMAAFKDGSFYAWSTRGIGTTAPLHSFTLPVAPAARTLQQCLALSADGELMVGSGVLLHAVALPAVGVLQSGRGGKVPGAVQLCFMPDSALVAALCADGVVRFVSVSPAGQDRVCFEIPCVVAGQSGGSFAMDRLCNQLALVADGKILLYDLAALRQHALPPVHLLRLKLHQIEAACSQALTLTAPAVGDTLDPTTQRLGQDPDSSNPGLDPDPTPGSSSRVPATVRPAAALPVRALAPAPLGDDARARASRVAAGERVAQRSAAGGRAVAGRAKAVAGRGQGLAPPAVQGHSAPAGAVVGASEQAAQTHAGGGLAVCGSPEGLTLNRGRLTTLLEAFGEYPAKYRRAVWDFLLALPHNESAHKALASQGPHPSYTALAASLPLASKSLAHRLAAVTSQLAHWCPLFEWGSGQEGCFELMATVLLNYARGWFACFPHPPVPLLNKLQDLLQFHDSPLAAHMRISFRGGLSTLAWALLVSAFSEVLPKAAWVQLWDHCFTAGPPFVYHFMIALLVWWRSELMGCGTDAMLAAFLASAPPVDMGKVLKSAYALCAHTPAPLQPCDPHPQLQPLPVGPSYSRFDDAPTAAVELFAQDRARILEAEEALIRRRKVVSELELQSRSVALQAGSLSSERQALSALEAQRRGALREMEAGLQVQLRQLDDRAKEEKLRQVALVEKAHQSHLVAVRSGWVSELAGLQGEVLSRREAIAQLLASRQEDESIKALEFAARQRMTELEDEAAASALHAKLRDELLSRNAALGAAQRAQVAEWEAEESLRALRAHGESQRRSRLAYVAEEAAAKAAVSREALALELTARDEMRQLDAERRLRLLAEDQAVMTHSAAEAEGRRLEAGAAAEEAVLRMEAQADVAWFDCEQLRREQLLAAERSAMEAAEVATRARLADTQAAADKIAGQAAILARRGVLERANATEEGETRRLLEAMLAERGRDASMAVALQLKGEEMRAKLAHAKRIGALQREVEVSAGRAWGGVRAALSEAQQRELSEVRQAHAAAMDRVAAQREAQIGALDVDWRQRLQGEELLQLRLQQLQVERKKSLLEAALGEQVVAAAGPHPPAHHTSPPPDNQAPPRQQQPSRPAGPLLSDGDVTPSPLPTPTHSTPDHHPLSGPWPLAHPHPVGHRSGTRPDAPNTRPFPHAYYLAALGDLLQPASSAAAGSRNYSRHESPPQPLSLASESEHPILAAAAAAGPQSQRAGQEHGAASAAAPSLGGRLPTHTFDIEGLMARYNALGFESAAATARSRAGEGLRDLIPSPQTSDLTSEGTETPMRGEDEESGSRLLFASVSGSMATSSYQTAGSGVSLPRRESGTPTVGSGSHSRHVAVDPGSESQAGSLPTVTSAGFREGPGAATYPGSRSRADSLSMSMTTAASSAGTVGSLAAESPLSLEAQSASSRQGSSKSGRSQDPRSGRKQDPREQRKLQTRRALDMDVSPGGPLAALPSIRDDEEDDDSLSTSMVSSLPAPTRSVRQQSGLASLSTYSNTDTATTSTPSSGPPHTQPPQPWHQPPSQQPSASISQPSSSFSPGPSPPSGYSPHEGSGSSSNTPATTLTQGLSDPAGHSSTPAAPGGGGGSLKSCATFSTPSSYTAGSSSAGSGAGRGADNPSCRVSSHADMPGRMPSRPSFAFAHAGGSLSSGSSRPSIIFTQAPQKQQAALGSIATPSVAHKRPAVTAQMHPLQQQQQQQGSLPSHLETCIPEQQQQQQQGLPTLMQQFLAPVQHQQQQQRLLEAHVLQPLPRRRPSLTGSDSGVSVPKATDSPQATIVLQPPVTISTQRISTNHVLNPGGLRADAGVGSPVESGTEILDPRQLVDLRVRILDPQARQSAAAAAGDVSGQFSPALSLTSNVTSTPVRAWWGRRSGQLQRGESGSVAGMGSVDLSTPGGSTVSDLDGLLARLQTSLGLGSTCSEDDDPAGVV